MEGAADTLKKGGRGARGGPSEPRCSNRVPRALVTRRSLKRDICPWEGGNGMLSLAKLARLVLLRCRNQIKLSTTMSGEEIGLDFNIGISGGNTELDV